MCARCKKYSRQNFMYLEIDMDNSLKNMFYRLINEYANLYAEVNRTQNFRHPFGSFIRNDIPNEIRRKGDIDQSKCKRK